jgi:hypothetical protein
MEEVEPCPRKIPSVPKTISPFYTVIQVEFNRVIIGFALFLISVRARSTEKSARNLFKTTNIF